jgi:hypothetical protein
MKNTDNSTTTLGLLIRSTLALVSACLLASVIVTTASATHFRYGQITWTQVSGNTVEATVQLAWRRAEFITCVDPTHPNVLSAPFPDPDMPDNAAIPCSGPDGFVGMGDVAAPFTAALEWGDGISPTTLYILVTSVDLVNNWFFGVALDPTSLPSTGVPTDTSLSHTYLAPGDYTAFFESCCRISPPDLKNNADGGFSVETIINAGGSNNSPVSVLPPIVLCPVDSLCSFFVPGADADGDTLSYRLSLSDEAKGIFGNVPGSADEFIQPGFDGPDIPGPDVPAPGPASIDPITGQYSWDTNGAGLSGDLYSTQVTIEDGESKIAVDFLIQLAQTDPNPPNIGVDPDAVCLPTNGQTVVVGSTLNFGVTASDSDGDALTLNVAGLPAGASMTPQLPLLGSPSMTVSSTFSWTPVIGDVGTSIVTFTASNFVGGFALCPVNIDVLPSIIPIAVEDPGNMANSGQLINIDVLANDLNLDDGVANLTTTPTPGAIAAVVGTAPNLSVNYTSAPGFGGVDTFTYTITDTNGDVSNSATVTIDVDGSVATTVAGSVNPVIFGGTVFPDSTAPISAAGEFAPNTGDSSILCCTVQDPRVGAGNVRKDGPNAFNWVDFDIGAALENPALADENCLDPAFLKPGPGKLIIPRHFGVHTEGVIFIDVAAEKIDGINYSVNCNATSLDDQPLTLALSTDKPGFTAPNMRATTADCDPRSGDRWSTSYFVGNAERMSEKETSKTYVGRKSSVFKNMMEAMRAEGAVDSSFIDDVKGLLLVAEKLFNRKKSTVDDARDALKLLDDVTRLTLLIQTMEPGSPSPPAAVPGPFGSSSNFSNPKGDMVSHALALRYAVCSELAWVGNLLPNCEIADDIVSALPPLPLPPPTP